MNRGQIINLAIQNLDSAISILQNADYAASKAASLAQQGYINQSVMPSIIDRFSEHSPEAVDLASQTLIEAQPKSAGYGDPVLQPEMADIAESDPDSRFSELDSMILGGNIFY